MMMVGTIYCTKRTSSVGSTIANTSHLGRMREDVANFMSAKNSDTYKRWMIAG